jgi:outer membrane protein TolC
VAEAQLIQAGILPNPSLAANYGFLLGGPAAFDSWSVGLTQDLKSIITISAKREGAKYELRQVDAEMVWAEWELVSKVALLVVDIVEGDQKARLLERTRGILDDLNSRAQRAYTQGNLDVSAVAPLSAALSGVDKDSADLAREQQSRHNDLDALLGLAPGVSFAIDPAIDLRPIAAEDVQKLLPDVTHRRPDLVALQLGYHSQEAKVRAAILGQFPALVFGGSYNVDTSHVRSGGPSISMDLPIFDRNQGQIAIEQATRQKLHDEFTSRLAAATTEIEASLAEDDLIERQLTVLQAALPGATKIEQAGASAYRAGNINGQSYVDLVSTRLSKEEDINALQQLLVESRIKIAGLLGMGIPSVIFPAYEEPKQ